MRQILLMKVSGSCGEFGGGGEVGGGGTPFSDLEITIIC